MKSKQNKETEMEWPELPTYVVDDNDLGDPKLPGIIVDDDAMDFPTLPGIIIDDPELSTAPSGKAKTGA